MTALGRQNGDELVVDLRAQEIESWDHLWDALTGPCGLPPWFGRNLDAWWDTIQTGAISETIDDHASLVVLLSRRGMFAPGNPNGDVFLEVTNRCDYAHVTVAPDL